MYLPAHFEQNDPDALHQLIAAHPLATLIGSRGESLCVEHLPLRWHCGNPQLSAGLIGHVARANEVWRALPDGSRVTAIFHGPQAYVSPSWYPSKREHGKVVPTWNYAVVHVEGRVHWTSDAASMHAILEALTDTHESPRERPWSVDDAPADYTAAMMRAIVGLRIDVESMRGKFKLSQNRNSTDRDGVIAGLSNEQADNAVSLAQMMRSSGGGQ